MGELNIELKGSLETEQVTGDSYAWAASAESILSPHSVLSLSCVCVFLYRLGPLCLTDVTIF